MAPLHEDGFLVVPGPLAGFEIAALAAAYDHAIACAAAGDVHRGRANLRVDGLVNGDPCFDRLYVYPPLLEAAAQVIGAPFKLSAFHARTVLPHAPAQELHRDFPPLADGWPMVGFIVMVDAFEVENGATRFVPGSQSRTALGEAESNAERCACGPAGSMVIFNGSIWHGYGANRTARPRRSIQGALIRRDQRSATDHAHSTRAETRARLGPVARDLLLLPS